MNIFYRFYCRVYQRVMKVVAGFLRWPTPKLIKGINAVGSVAEVVKGEGLSKVIIVTDKIIAELPFMGELIEGLEKEKINYYIYDKTIVNPTIDNVEEAAGVYKTKGCEGIIAIGGGSSIDCAKALGARIAKPKKSISKMKGVLKVRKKLPPVFVIPTTAGTGSEATIAAVITDTRTHEKYAINDIALIPKYAVLDPLVTRDLPKNITSTTGMDALTHAVEAYIGKSNTRETRELSRKAVKLIYENLYEAYVDGSDLNVRENMQMASYFAGVAFTKAYVGYVHAIAHTLGGFYSIPHGLANAVILPYVLEAFGSSVDTSLGELADLVGLTAPGDSQRRKAEKFIESVIRFNEKMDIPRKLTGIQEEHIPLLARRALKEAHPLYPVPKLLTLKEIEKIYFQIK